MARKQPPSSSDPFRPRVPAIQCPKCGERKEIDVRQLQFEIMRHCRSCGVEWSGGSMAAGRPAEGPEALIDLLNRPEGVPIPPTDPEEERPAVQFTGAPHRDPSKNYGDED